MLLESWMETGAFTLSPVVLIKSGVKGVGEVFETEVTVMDGGEVEVPVPTRVTACGLPPPSSLISREAVRPPAAAGVKMTLTVQLAPAPKLLPQVLVLLWEKSPAFAPRNAICQRLTPVPPSLVITTGSGLLGVPTCWLLKVRLEGTGLIAAPTPVRMILCTPLPELSVMLMEDLRGPAACGVKVAWSVQPLPAATVLGEIGQLSVTPKSLLFAPKTVMLLIVNGLPLLLVRVTVL